MSEEFERELAEDWESAADNLEMELTFPAADGRIEIMVEDAVEFSED